MKRLIQLKDVDIRKKDFDSRVENFYSEMVKKLKAYLGKYFDNHSFYIYEEIRIVRMILQGKTNIKDTFGKYHEFVKDSNKAIKLSPTITITNDFIEDMRYYLLNLRNSPAMIAIEYEKNNGDIPVTYVFTEALIRYLQYLKEYNYNQEKNTTQMMPVRNKPYKSYTRAIAIYFRLLQINKRIGGHLSKNDILKLVENWKNPKTNQPMGQQNFYQVFATGKNGNRAISALSQQELKELYPKDYEFALTLLDNK